LTKGIKNLSKPYEMNFLLLLCKANATFEKACVCPLFYPISPKPDVLDFLSEIDRLSDRHCGYDCGAIEFGNDGT
jgi:hypothetical protein